MPLTFLYTVNVVKKISQKMNVVDIIKRMRECEIKWTDISYCLDINLATAQMALKRETDIKEFGVKPVIKKGKFGTPVIPRLKRVAIQNEKLSVRDMEGELMKDFPGKAIPSKSTTQNILTGFKVVKLLKKVMIWPRNQLKRVEFCNQMLEYGPGYWDTVIWGDETTVRQRPKDKDIHIRGPSSELYKAERINPQVHSGGFSVMFWGCFSKVGLGPLVALEGNMNAANYLELLKDTVFPELAASGPPMVFMQDNAPCHKARVVMDFLRREGVETLDWPPQSLDMNPIKNRWAKIKARHKKKFS
jgi:hypothetical protein